MTRPHGGFVADLRTVLRGRDFRRLFAVRLTGQFGDGVLQVGLASYVFFSPERQATASAAAAAFAVLLLPYSLVGPFAGVLLDRWRRRQVLLWANVVRTVLALVVAGLVIGGHAGPVFYATALATLSVNRFILAGLSASLPHVVPRHELVMANAVSPTTGTVTAVLGGLTGFLLSRAVGGSANEGTDVAVLTAAAGVYLAAGLLALRIYRDLLGPDLRGGLPDPWRAVHHVGGGLASGARHVAHRPPAARALGAIAAHRFFYGVSTVAVILLHRNYFHDVSDVDGGLTGLATVFVATAVGLVVAAVLTPVVTRRRIAKEWWVVTLLVAAAVLQVFPAALYTEPAVLVAAAGLGVASQGIKIVVDTVVQESVEDEYRGRVFSIYDMLFNVGFVAAAAFAAATLPLSGRSYAVLGVISAGYLLTALWYGRGLRRTPAAPPTSGAAPPAPPPGPAAPGPAAPPAGAGTPDPPPVREAPPARP